MAGDPLGHHAAGREEGTDARHDAGRRAAVELLVDDRFRQRLERLVRALDGEA